MIRYVLPILLFGSGPALGWGPQQMECYGNTCFAAVTPPAIVPTGGHCSDTCCGGCAGQGTSSHHYTVDEIDRMRVLLTNRDTVFPMSRDDYLKVRGLAEQELQTYMRAGITLEELEASEKKP
jgi:hypothetical protein